MSNSAPEPFTELFSYRKPPRLEAMSTIETHYHFSVDEASGRVHVRRHIVEQNLYESITIWTGPARELRNACEAAKPRKDASDHFLITLENSSLELKERDSLTGKWETRISPVTTHRFLIHRMRLKDLSRILDELRTESFYTSRSNAG